MVNQTPTRPTQESPSSTPRALPAGNSPSFPPNTKANKKKRTKIKQEDDEDALAVQAVDTHDPGYESSVDAPIELTATQLELEEEKKSYPGASTWAEEEVQLFEILFQRAEIPLLPAHWDVDFRGIPVVDSIFQEDDELLPIIYSRSAKEFQATMALLRLIDLTSSVRTTIQSGLRRKAPSLIKKSLDKYIAWAAEDGGYFNLRTVPNIATAVMDAELGEQGVPKAMKNRMRALAMAQREFLRVDRDESFWDVSEVEAETKDGDLSTMLVEKYLKKIEAMDQTAKESPKVGCPSSTPLEDSTPTRARFTRSPSPHQPAPEKEGSTPEEVKYRQKPPVVYGLFVLRTTVFVLTVDSAKGDSAYVSFHVDMHFHDRHQSVWNALTAGIAVCLARDQLVARMDEFEEVPAPAAESGSEA